MDTLFVAPKLHRVLRPAADTPPLRDQFAPHVVEATLGMLGPDLIEAAGEDLGIVRKHRVHHAGLLACAMVLAAVERGSDFEGRWLDTQVIYRRLGGPDSGTTSIRKMGRRLRPLHKRSAEQHHQQPDHLDSFRLALAVHALAEANVMRALLGRHDSATLRAMAAHADADHVRMQAAAVGLSRLRPGSDRWYEGARALRIAALDHASRAELARWTLVDHLVPGRRETLAADYATERFRILTRPSQSELWVSG